MTQFQLLPDAIVGGLPLYEYQTRYTTSVAAVALRLEQAPELPGVLVVDGRGLVGVLSRQQLERLKQGATAYPRDLQTCLPVLPPVLELPDTCPIPIAVERALQRSAADCYEPIVIKLSDGSRRLLDMQRLLLAQMEIFAQLYQMSQYQQVHIQGSSAQLQQAQQRVAALQATEQAQAQRLLECQLQLAQPPLMAEGRDRLEPVQEFFRQSWRQLLQSITSTIDTMAHRTNMMAVIGRSVAQELEHLAAAATVVKKLSQQSRFLGLRAAVLVSRFSSETEGLGQVMADVGHLSDQARQTGQQLDETADRIKNHLAELAQLAQLGVTAIHPLIDAATHSATALTAVENILDPAAVSSGLTPQADDNLLAVRSWQHKAQQVDSALLELEQLVKSDGL